MKNKKIPDYLVIGSGFAALSVSALLTRVGYKVTLLEAHTVAWGLCSYF